jgi:hypothetical protein
MTKIINKKIKKATDLPSYNINDEKSIYATLWAAYGKSELATRAEISEATFVTTARAIQGAINDENDMATFWATNEAIERATYNPK